MKSSFFPTKVLWLLVMSLLYATVVSAQDGITPTPTKSNWSNSMGFIETNQETEFLCLELGERNLLFFTLYVQTSVPYVESFLPMKFIYRYYINNVLVANGEEPTVTNSMMRYNMNTGLYVASFEREFDCTPYIVGVCDPEYVYNFRLEYQLVRAGAEDSNGNPVPYPIGQCPMLWPPTVFNIPAPHESYVDDLHQVAKWICCPEEVVRDPIIKQQDGETAYSESINSVHAHTHFSDMESAQAITLAGQDGVGLTAAPNPFSNKLTTSFVLGEPGAVVFKCLDSQGRLVKEVNTYYETAGLHTSEIDLSTNAPGLYYLCLYTNNGKQVLKVIKN